MRSRVSLFIARSLARSLTRPPTCVGRRPCLSRPHRSVTPPRPIAVAGVVPALVVVVARERARRARPRAPRGLAVSQLDQARARRLGGATERERGRANKRLVGGSSAVGTTRRVVRRGGLLRVFGGGSPAVPREVLSVAVARELCASLRAHFSARPGARINSPPFVSMI